MAQDVSPVPNTPLLPDPTRDVIWKRWFAQVYNRVATSSQIYHNSLAGLQGGTTDQYYHLTSSQHATVSSLGAFDNNRVLFTDAVSTIATSGDLLYDSANSTFTAQNVSTLGNTTIGNASSDSLTINAGTWTIGNNYIATRAAGTVATGVVNLQVNNNSAVGDSGGNSNIRGYLVNLTVSSTPNLTALTAYRNELTYSGTGTVALAQANTGILTLSGTGTITNAYSFNNVLIVNTSGAINTGVNFNATNLNLSGGGTVSTHVGFRASDFGNASISTCIGFLVNNIINSPIRRGYVGEQVSGSGAANLYMSGTADNILVGNVRIGSTVEPTEALDVTGNVRVDGGIALNIRTVTTAAYSTVAADFTVLGNASSLAITVHLPNASTFPTKIYNVKKIDSSVNVVTISSVSLIDGANTQALAAQWDSLQLQCNSTAWYVI